MQTSVRAPSRSFPVTHLIRGHRGQTPQRALITCLVAIVAEKDLHDAISSPQLPGGLGHTPVSRRRSNISQQGPCTDHTTTRPKHLCCSSRLTAAPAPQLLASIPEKVVFVPDTFDSAARLGQIPLFPGRIPYLILKVTGFDFVSASGPIPVNSG